MNKKLSEMSLEELWQLFPIILSEHNIEWKDWYKEEKNSLIKLLGGDIKINHIGSTAIQNIWAKPIVDIMIEFSNWEKLVLAKNILLDNGYRLMSEEEGRVSLKKGYTEKGFDTKVFHLHLRLSGDNDEIIFCDYLNNHPDIAKEYEKLKLGLWKKYEHNRDAYTNAKTDFIVSVVELAKGEK